MGQEEANVIKLHDFMKIADPPDEVTGSSWLEHMEGLPFHRCMKIAQCRDIPQVQPLKAIDVLFPTTSVG